MERSHAAHLRWYLNGSFLTQSYAESGAEERRVFQVRGSEWGGKREGYCYLSNVLTVKTCGGVESGG